MQGTEYESCSTGLSKDVLQDHKCSFTLLELAELMQKPNKKINTKHKESHAIFAGCTTVNATSAHTASKTVNIQSDFGQPTENNRF